MDDLKLKKLEKYLWGLFALLGLIFVIGLILLFLNGKPSLKEKNAMDNVSPESTEEQIQTKEYDWEEGLSDSTIWLPENCDLYEPLPEITFQDNAGNLKSLSDFSGTPVVLVFWASWCRDCQEQMPHMSEYMELAEEYGTVRFLFINRLDGTKETRENADAYFQTLGLKENCYYDEAENAYKALGIRNIPTTLFIDAEGRLISWSPKQITQKEVFEAHIQNLLQGNSKELANFVRGQLMDENGGIHSEYVAGDKSATEKSAVLSESQGAWLEYAVLTQNRELFEQGLAYVEQWMKTDGPGLSAWCVTDGKASSVNALIDDFRIYGALKKADLLWGGYGQSLDTLENAIAKGGIHKGNYVDFYDANNKEYADILTLCYIDLTVMEMLGSEEKELQTAGEKAREILLEGQISENFPLYYSRYDYSKKSYTNEDLNMAEAMVTLLHLSEAGCLPQNTVEWLKQEMSRGGIMARYDVEGNVVDGYRYESTAIYALLALVAENQGEVKLRGQALRKMEKMRILDSSSACNGAFGMADGSGITSFDQLMPLLTYATLESNFAEKTE